MIIINFQLSIINSMRIWIVNYYTSPTCANPRYLEMAKYFMAAGHKVLTFYANYNGNKEAALFKPYTVNGLDFVEVKSPHFEGNGLKRMKSIYIFSRTLMKHCEVFEKPDVILHNIHPPFDYPIVKLAKKIPCKYIAEAWDLWPQAFVTYGLIGAKNPLMKWAYSIEKKYYCAADEIIFTFLGALDYLKRHGWMKEQGGQIDSEHFHYINNGINLAKFDCDRDEYPRPDADMNDDSLYRIIYLGTVSRVNNVKTLIDTAALLKDNPKYRFIIYGDGADRESLEQYVVDNNINNVVFKEKRIKFEECAWVVSQATVNIMNYRNGFGQWGVSSGKMFQYLAAGKPIVCNINICYDNVINDNNLGVSKNIKTSEEFATEIKRLAELPQEDYDAMCERVREVAKRFDYKVLAAQELEIIENAVRAN